MKKHLNIRIFGFVQGVCFRYYAAQTAAKLGVTGIVRNEPDGSVYLEAEGDEEALARFVDWCSHGPPPASVDKAVTTPAKLKNYQNFRII
jgi:acylphosphatase